MLARGARQPGDKKGTAKQHYQLVTVLFSRDAMRYRHRHRRAIDWRSLPVASTVSAAWSTAGAAMIKTH